MLYAQVDELSIGEMDKRVICACAASLRDAVSIGEMGKRAICACAASLRDAQVDALCVKLTSAKYLKKREMDE